MKSKSAVRSIILCIIGIYLIILFCLNFAQIGSPEFYDLNHKVTTHITDPYGNTTTYHKMFFPNLSRGSQIVFDLPIPEQSPFNTRAALCFYQYHSEIDIYAGEELVYSYGADLTEKKRMYGNEFIVLPILNRYWGQTLNIIVRQKEGLYSNHYTYFRLMKLEDARLYPLIGSSLEFILFGTTLVLSICMFVVFLVNRLSGKRISMAIASISVFCYLLSIWQLSSRRLFYVFSDDVALCSLAEYYSLFLIPIPLFGYMGHYQIHASFKRIYFIISATFAAFFAYCIGMHQIYHYHIVEFEVLMYTLLFVSLLVAIYIEVFRTRKTVNQENIMRYGILIAMMMVVFQLILLFLRNQIVPGPVLGFLISIDFSSVAILIYMGALIFTAGEAAVELIRQNAAEAQTRKLAYMDIMTGIPNRLYCEEYMEKLSVQDDYSIVFMDADRLKFANDTYGHKMGDRLLNLIAEVIRKNFDTEGCYARWGGDEFIAVVPSHEKAEEFVHQMIKSFEEINSREEMPFPVSVSYGIADHKINRPETPDQIRDMADERMYQYKINNHRER